MPILNYTTQVSIDRTIQQIQKCLTSHGAKSIMMQYDDEGNITAMNFVITIENGNDIAVKLPAEWEAILKILKDDHKVPSRLETKEQAIRVCWRIIKDWVEAQMAILETKMVKMEQIFLPYILDVKTGQSFYERVISDGLIPSSKRLTE